MFPHIEDEIPGVHATSWMDDEGQESVTIGIPGPEVSTLWVGDHEEVLRVLDMLDGYIAPLYNHPLYVALEAHLERLAS